MEVLIGGPVETTRGFVLHSPDFHMAQSTLPIDDGVCLTATIDILRALARGEGPKDAILALGYAGWSAGQLENEIQSNGWLNCPADADLLFGTSVEARYNEALRRIGVEPAMLSGEAGHAWRLRRPPAPLPRAGAPAASTWVRQRPALAHIRSRAGRVRSPRIRFQRLPPPSPFQAHAPS